MKRLTNCKIVLADDDVDDLYLFEQALKQVDSDAVLITYENGDDLMQSLLKNEANLPDVVFLDLNMPKKGGIGCLEEIHRHDSLKELPVVVLTTSIRQEDIKAAYKHKACLFFHKPDSLPKLVAIIQKVLSMDLSPWNPIAF
ncbi:response regulator [Chitinophagaceae bacterium LB-8]|uniref:Response regulator n=1 Tax=Paraflavisolibacter caeni TaxID=2982496 RepID=A0A9X2XYS2_9BACT|nr:response regulator [Paraflavisolibacter caeni]MCU7552034.1 response regulator [Paraflavisolibacter caeni]